MQKIKLARIKPKQTIQEIGNWIVEKILATKMTGSVIGLSGGVDSTVTAAITKLAFDKHNAKKSSKKLILKTYALPSHINSTKDTLDAQNITKKLKIPFSVINLEQIISATKHILPPMDNFQTGNMISRIRGVVILNTLAALEKKFVIGTGNRDEDFGIGYYTLFGDGAVHLSPLDNLPKRLVKQLACFLGFPKIANREPTAGLELDQTDFGDLGYSYDFVELMTEGLLQNFSIAELKKHEQVLTLATQEIATYKKQFKIKKFTTTKEMIDNFLKKNQLAKKKAELVNPPIAPVSLLYG
jgi:NAD+ synthase